MVLARGSRIKVSLFRGGGGGGWRSAPVVSALPQEAIVSIYTDAASPSNKRRDTQVPISASLFCIAYYYSTDRAGRPVSEQENASRRSGKAARRGHARRYEQMYTGCLIIDERKEYGVKEYR